MIESLLAVSLAVLIGFISESPKPGATVNIDLTVTLTAMLQLPILAGVFYVVRFISIQKDFPPHRHTNGSIFYPKGYAPEKSDSNGPR